MAEERSRFFSWSLLPRLVGLGVLVFIIWLLLSTLLMPLVSTSATRAILNAPVILLTTPIEGVVNSLEVKPGSTFTQGQKIAVVENPRANQETLLTLQTRRLTLEQELSSSASQAEHDTIDPQLQRSLHLRGSNTLLRATEPLSCLSRRISAQGFRYTNA